MSLSCPLGSLYVVFATGCDSIGTEATGNNGVDYVATLGAYCRAGATIVLGVNLLSLDSFRGMTTCSIRSIVELTKVFALLLAISVLVRGRTGAVMCRVTCFSMVSVALAGTSF
jgi:hypothetical protein